MALSEILSVYRQGLATERQSRLAEQQLALSALQFESQQQFRDEGRQREDIMGALQFAQQSTKEALGQDTSQIYSKVLGLRPIAEADYDETSGAMQSTNKIINKLTRLGYTEQDAIALTNIANTYGMASKNPALAQSAQSMASDFAQRVSRDYNIWKESGFSQNRKGYQPKSPLMKAMESSGLMYKGGDQLQRDLSIDSFIGVGDALTALDNIEQERLDIGKGDYKIDSKISVNENLQSGIADTDFESLVGEAGVNLGMTGTEEGGVGVNIQDEISAGVEMGEIEQGQYGVTPTVSDEDIMGKLDFLPQSDQDNIEAQLSDLNEEIANKMVSLDGLYTERDERVSGFNLMEKQYDKMQARKQYFFELEGRKGKNYLDAANESLKLERNINSSVEAREAQVSTGYRSGTMGIGNLNQGMMGENPEYTNTYSKDIIKLSQEIEDLNRKKLNYAPR
ncbi:hypothetical protein N9990_00165 [bacterium]|nr:hypothetical protein [bacterium]